MFLLMKCLQNYFQQKFPRSPKNVNFITFSSLSFDSLKQILLQSKVTAANSSFKITDMIYLSLRALSIPISEQNFHYIFISYKILLEIHTQRNSVHHPPPNPKIFSEFFRVVFTLAIIFSRWRAAAYLILLRSPFLPEKKIGRFIQNHF